MTETVLVAGASGLVGLAAAERFLSDGYDVIAVSRRVPEVRGAGQWRHVALDMRDADACAAAASDFGGVTHVVYAAVHELPGLVAGWTEPEQMDTNLTMLHNLLDPLAAAASGLRHVSLLQGTKAYGAHVHPIPVPARERFPRDQHANFYWLQEDLIRERSAVQGWDFTIWRPQLIVGPNHGVVMNLPPVIGAFAAICREEGRPFGFPGGARWVWECVDTRLVADAMAWAATSPNAAGETFNLTNGEVFEWRSLWPSFADTFGLEAAPDEPCSLAELLPARADMWDRIVARHGLRPIQMADLLGESHHYADVCFAYRATESPPPVFVSTVKIKQAGFCGVYDTEESFRHWHEDLIARRIVPGP
jgi:nucleoside-diphosphate-sugar epimerase